MDDPTQDTLQQPAGTDAGGSPAAGTHPSPSHSSAAASAGNTAPPANAARDAYEKLAQGADPRTVNQGYRKAVDQQPTPARGKSHTTAAKKDDATAGRQ